MSWPLPQELTDYIVDYLADDKRVLRTCALICRAFVRRSRAHVFEEVVLSYSPSDDNFLDVCSYSTTVLQSVRTLHIDCLRSQQLLQLPRDELLIFPSLRHLLLQSVKLEDAPEFFLSILSQFSFRTLTMERCSFGKKTQLCQSVQGLRDAGHLDLVECRIVSSSFNMSPHACEHKHFPLHSLTLVQSCNALYKSLLRCRGAMDHLTCASVYLGAGPDFSLLSALLADTKETLVELHVHLSRQICNNQWIVTVNLSTPLAISHLHKFSIHQWGTGSVKAPVTRWLLRSVVASSPHRLDEIEFIVNMSTEDMQIGITIDYEVWREISSVASLQQFARLRAIRIVVGLRSHPQFRWGTPLTRSDVVQVMEGIQKQFDTFRGKREVLAFEVDTTDKIPKFE